MKQRTLYCDLLLRGSPSLFPVFCLSVFLFVFGMRSIITKTDVHSMTHTSPLTLSPTPTPRPQTLSLFYPYLINITLSYIRVESIGVRARGARGFAVSQILGNSDFFGSTIKFRQSQFLKTSACFYYYYLQEINIFYFNLKSA